MAFLYSESNIWSMAHKLASGVAFGPASCPRCRVSRVDGDPYNCHPAELCSRCATAKDPVDEAFDELSASWANVEIPEAVV